MAKPKMRRKKYLILIKFQLKYIFYILLFLYIGAAVAGYTVYWTTWVTLGDKLANVYPTGRLLYIFRAANITLLLRILLITPIFVLIGTFLSHRIAGPIFRINKYIDALISGDYSQGLHLRKKDELKDVAEKLGKLREALSEKRKQAKGSLDDLKSKIESGDNLPTKSMISKIEEIKGNI